MLSHAFYNTLHVFGILLLATGTAGMAMHVANGGTRQTNSARVLVAAMHGLGALFILVAGFGMLARLEAMHGAGFPGWVWAKLGIWLLLVAAAFAPYRWPALARPILIALPVLGALAAYLAIYKPL
jgi:hypothetical protein